MQWGDPAGSGEQVWGDPLWVRRAWVRCGHPMGDQESVTRGGVILQGFLLTSLT